MLRKLTYVSLLILSVTACSSNKPEPPLQGEASHTKNASKSLDYRRNYKEVLASKSVLAIQTVKGPQAGNWSSGEKEMTLTINGHTYNMTDRIDITALPDGLLERKYDAKGKELLVAYPDNKIVETREKGTMYLYQQPYSVVIATLPTEYQYDGKSDPKGRLGKENTFQVKLVSGLPTSDDVIKSLNGKATYQGKAFANFGKGVETGELTYAIDFDSKKGSGSITGIDSTGKITLKEGSIGSASPFNPLSTAGRVKGISSSAETEKMKAYYYYVSIFGPKAEEVAGYVTGSRNSKEGEWHVGFGGEKQP